MIANPEPVIRIEQIKKYYKQTTGLFNPKVNYIHAVDDVSLTVQRGEVVGLVGESGSGKTTLARLILGLVRPTANTVYINGVDIFKTTGSRMREIRKTISVVFQDPAASLNPRVTIGDSLMRPLIINGLRQKSALEEAEAIMDKVKLDSSYLKRYPHQLSGGQLQRVSIGRALILKPEVIILDEPTSALDISVQAQILNLLLELQGEFNLTYLLITHDLNVIRYISDRVAVMYLGKVVEIGETDSVFKEARHPYTIGLMASSPILDPRQRNREKFLMQGEPDSLINLPQGCRLSTRCPYKVEQCLTEVPILQDLGNNHFSACIYHDRFKKCV
jgi:oligopeptide/dipeptide ABC transporter ATP-binding protein